MSKITIPGLDINYDFLYEESKQIQRRDLITSCQTYDPIIRKGTFAAHPQAEINGLSCKQFSDGYKVIINSGYNNMTGRTKAMSESIYTKEACETIVESLLSQSTIDKHTEK